MAKLNFPQLILNKKVVKKLLKEPITNNLKKLCFQFYWNESGDFSLVAQRINEDLKCIKSSLIFLKAVDNQKSLKVKIPVILGQFELSFSRIEELSRKGELDLIFTPTDEFKINPVAVSYQVNGAIINPCPPADPPA